MVAGDFWWIEKVTMRARNRYKGARWEFQKFVLRFTKKERDMFWAQHKELEDWEEPEKIGYFVAGLILPISVLILEYDSEKIIGLCLIVVGIAFYYNVVEVVYELVIVQRKDFTKRFRKFIIASYKKMDIINHKVVYWGRIRLFIFSLGKYVLLVMKKIQEKYIQHRLSYSTYWVNNFLKNKLQFKQKNINLFKKAIKSHISFNWFYTYYITK